MIRERINQVLEDKLCKTEYGFRPSRSTSRAIYVIRRLQDFAEMKGRDRYFCLLDWENAFDKIDHDALFSALERLDIDPHFVEVLKNCYRHLNQKGNFQESGRDAQFHPTSSSWLWLALTMASG